MGRPIIPVRTYMATVIEEHRDPQTDEINSTTLAEDACQHFGPFYPVSDGGDIPEWISDMAVDLALADEQRRQPGINCPAAVGFVNAQPSTHL